MHKRITEINNLLKEYKYEEQLFNDACLHFLNSRNVSATETIITYFLVYNIPIKESEKNIYNSNVFPKESIEDVAFQTFLYLFDGKEGEEKKSITTKFKLE